VWSKELLEREGISVFPVSRGGKWTYHGPGQILIYPILHLPSHGYSSKSVRIFLEDLRLAIKDELEILGCSKLTLGEPFGLYLENKKLVSFGFAFERGISSHGLAVYYTDQSRYFSGIHPCGVCQGQSASLLDGLTSQTSWNSVANSLANRIKNRFSLRLSRVL
jgi:lipoyl(octanoyl) transferase